MSRTSNSQLQFFIKLTQIIGRTFSDLQQLLVSQLQKQESDNLANIPQVSKPIAPLSQNSHLPSSRYQDGKSHQSEEYHDQKDQKQQSKRVQDRQKENQQASKSKFIPKQKQSVEKKTKTKKKKIRKDRKDKKKIQEGKPLPPLNAFMLFLKLNKQDLMKKRPQLSPSEVSTYASTIWNSLGDTQKQQYREMYKKNNQVYKEELRIFKEQSQSKPTVGKKLIQKAKPNLKIVLRPKRGLRRMRKITGEQEVICVESQAEQESKEEQKDYQI